MGGKRPPHMFGNVAGKDIHARHIKRDRNHTKSSIDAFAQPEGDTLPNVLVERHHNAMFDEKMQLRRYMLTGILVSV